MSRMEGHVSNQDTSRTAAVPQPSRGNSPTRLSSRHSTKPSATQRSSSTVYAVANPAILAAQEGSAKTQRSYRDSLDLGNTDTDTGEISTAPYSERRLKSRTNKEAKEPQADTPSTTDADWETPRAPDTQQTPHQESPAKNRFSPTKNSFDNEEERNKDTAPEQSKSRTQSPEQKDRVESEVSQRSAKSQRSEVSQRSARSVARQRSAKSAARPRSGKTKTPVPTAESPTPVDQDERNLESATLPVSSDKKVNNSLPTVQRVYVDSPTFTKEEEAEYRFVESRLGEIQDDVEETLKKLDQETEKQRNIRKKLEDQMATMYAPAYQDQRGGGKSYGDGYSQQRQDDRGAYQDNYRRGSQADPKRDNMGSYGNLRNTNDSRSQVEPQRYNQGYTRYGDNPQDNMGSVSNLRRENDNRQGNMGSYGNLRGDNRQDNLGSYGSLRRDSEQRQDNMGSYGNVRRDDQRQDNMGSYGNLRRDDPRQDNMGSYGNIRREDPRQDNIGSYGNMGRDDPRQDNLGSYGNLRRDDQRQDNMGSYGNYRREDDYDQGRDYMGSYGDVAQSNNQETYRPSGVQDNKQDQDRYEDRDRYEDDTNQEYGAPRHHVLNGNYETHDDELKREFEYQENLKHRIEESGRRVNEVQIPRLPIESEVFRDSLEEEGYGDWKNPPPNPYAREDIGQTQQGGYIQQGDYPQQENYPQQGGYRNQPPQEEEEPEFMDRNDTARMEVVHPREPTYDFVENNKIDYGKPPERTYRVLKQQKEEESKKLETAFIQPKVPKKKHYTKFQTKSAPSKLQENMPPRAEEIDSNDPAQALWAKRSAALKKKDNARTAPSKKKGLQRFDSDTRITRPPPHYLSSNQQSPNRMYGTPTRNNYLEPIGNRRAPPPSSLPPVASRSEPPTFADRTSPYRKPHELKPITQEIITEDGQRISVDINLKVVSPPPSGGPPMVQAEVLNNNRRPTGQQYQAEVYNETPQDTSQLQSQYYDPYYRRNYYYEQSPQYDNYGNQENVAPNDPAPAIGQQQYRGNDPVYSYSPTNPYPKIPPIAISEEELDRQIADMEGDGYAAMYKRNKDKPKTDKPWYQIYTISDYKKMQQEVRLNQGTLGPDLDNETYKEKLEKRHKQFEYARMVMEKNRQELEGKSKPPPKPTKNEENSKRKAAIEYSKKNIPKPTVKPRPNQYNSYEVAAQLSPIAKHNQANQAKSPKTVDVIDLQKLQQRHEQEKQNVAMIRQNIETVPQKA